MKNILKVSLALSVICLVANAEPSKAVYDANYEYVIVLEKGKQKSIRALKAPKSGYEDTKTTYSKDGLLVEFNDTSKLELSKFEQKYDLKLKTKMRIGYHIFENLSSKSDVEIVQQIIQNETNIKTVKPNWKLKNELY